MGNDSSSPVHGRYDDDETTIDGTSVFSTDTRETGFSAVSQNTGMSSRIYRSSSRSDRGAGSALGGVLNSNLIDAICGGNNFFEDDDDDDDEDEDPRYSRRKSGRGDSNSRKKKKKDKRSSREHSHDESYGSDGSYDSPEEDRRGRSSRTGKSSKSKRGKEKSKNKRSDDSILSEEGLKDDTAKSLSKESVEINPKLAVTTNNASFDSAHSNSKTAAKITLTKPLASSFAKRCYFTKAGIGKIMQHYEGITLTGNTVLMLASAMKLKGCPTICDEDLKRVEQTYPNQFSRLPDELLLSSGWRRISKYCHFSGKAIPDGVPFFHSRERCHPNGGYFFLLAASIGMERPSDVEPLTLDMLILLQTDFPTQCDQAPDKLIEDPGQWTLVTRFCFFSGGPINSDEDVYYKAMFNGSPIYMLAFLSPNMTPEELYRLNDITGENALKSVAAVEEVETVYDLTDRDFDDLKLYHLGPCRALPQPLLNPNSWEKALPKHFMECRENALARAFEYEVHAQEAIAKAGKMVATHSREQSYESIGANQPASYDSGNYPSGPSHPLHPMNNQFGSQQHDHGQYMTPQKSGSGQQYNNGPPTRDQGSYVEMHQIGDEHGRTVGSHRSSGDEGTLGLANGQQRYEGFQHSSQPHNDIEATYDQTRHSLPFQDSQHAEEYEQDLHDDPTEGGVVHDDPTVDVMTHAEDPTVGDNEIHVEDPTVFEILSEDEDSDVEQDESYDDDEPTVGGADDPTVGNTIAHDDPTVGDTLAYDDDDDDDPTVGDVITRADDPTVGDTMTYAEDPTVTDNMTRADDPTIKDDMTYNEDPTLADNMTRADDPTVKPVDSDDHALDDYYQGIEQQEEDHPDDEFRSHHSLSSDASTSNKASDLDAFNHEMNRASQEEGAFVSTQQSQPEDDDSGVYENYDQRPSSPQESEYVSMKEMEPGSPEISYRQEVNVDEEEEKSLGRDSYVDPPSPPMTPQHITPSSRPSSSRGSSRYEKSVEEPLDKSQPNSSRPSSRSKATRDSSRGSTRHNKPLEEHTEQTRPSSSRGSSRPNSTRASFRALRESSRPSSTRKPSKSDKVPEEPTRISSYAGYGFARQFSSTPRSHGASSPKYSTPQRTTPVAHHRPDPVTYDDPSVDNMSDDEPSPQIQLLDPPTFSQSHDNRSDVISPQSHVASPHSRGSKSALSPDSSYTQGTSSAAMKGARELLKKNRHERLALMSKRRVAHQKAPVKSPRVVEDIDSGSENKEPVETSASSRTLYSHARSRSVTPNKKRFQGLASPTDSPAKKALTPASPPYGPMPPKTPPSSRRKNFNKDVGFGSPTSDVSGASSAWTSEPESGDKDSRRALILKMAKSRMKSKKELKSPRAHKVHADLD